MKATGEGEKKYRNMKQKNMKQNQFIGIILMLSSSFFLSSSNTIERDQIEIRFIETEKGFDINISDTFSQK